MNFNLNLGRLKLSFGRNQPAPKRPSKFGRRSFPGAAMNRLTADWQSPSSSADQEIYGAGRTLIFRCRQLERSNDYIRRYLKLVNNNVLGSRGIGLQMKIQDAPGRYDKAANDAVEAAWKKWSRREFCTLSGRLNWRAVQKLVLRSRVRDGGALVRLVRVPLETNPFGFCLQPLEIDYLDFDFNRSLGNGNEIRFGIEYDPAGRVVSYHIFDRHPGDMNQAGRRRIPVPASEMIHCYLPERIGQSLGLPTAVSSMLRLNMLEGYEEAEVTAAREGACKGGYIEKTAPEDYTADGEDDQGNQIHEMEPGVIRELEPNQKFVEHDPTHPNTAYGPFVKQVLRGLASGLGVSYVSLANDLEGVNYSSIRAGLLDEREEWKELQECQIEDLNCPVFEAWLEMALNAGQVKLTNGSAISIARFEKFNAPEWKPRRWAWVDPEKDMRANILAVEKGFDSRRSIIAEAGRDVEEVFDEQAADDQLAAQKGLDFPKDVQTGGNGNVDKTEETDGQDD
jgi:lambda family phage portal protein